MDNLLSIKHPVVCQLLFHDNCWICKEPFASSRTQLDEFGFISS
jgi:hypothetical protein